MELIYSQKTRFNNMSFCKQSSSNVFIKSIHLHNSSRNIQSAITNVFPTSTETVRTKNFLPSYSSIIKTYNISKNTKNITIENSKLSLLQEKEINNGFINHLIYNYHDIKKSQ